jgi:Lrp/AsnC family transcriptional regulator, leucine-responsive regulatory protein
MKPMTPPKMEESSEPDLDRIDLNILRALQAEGRLSNAELATRVNVSPATCHRRTQRLFEEGYITGVRAEVTPAAVGLGALVMVGVVLDRSTPDSFAAFEKVVLAIKDVLECNLVAGDFDYLLKIRVRDMVDFNKLHGQTLIALPGVRQTRTFFVMKEVKENARLAF